MEGVCGLERVEDFSPAKQLKNLQSSGPLRFQDSYLEGSGGVGSHLVTSAVSKKRSTGGGETTAPADAPAQLSSGHCTAYRLRT